MHLGRRLGLRRELEHDLHAVDRRLLAAPRRQVVFADNLRHLLLAPPLGDKAVLGIDPFDQPNVEEAKQPWSRALEDRARHLATQEQEIAARLHQAELKLFEIAGLSPEAARADILTRLDAELEASPYDSARWLSGPEAEIEKFAEGNRGGMATDRDGAPVFLAKSAWELGYVADKFSKVKMLKTRERYEVQA